MDRQLIEVSSSTILRVVIAGLALVFLWFVRDIVLMLLLSIVIASAVDPPVSWLRRQGLPRSIGVLLVYAGAVAILGAIIYLIVPPLLDEFQALAARFPTLLEQLFKQFQNTQLLGSKNVIFERFEDYLGETFAGLAQITPQVFNGTLVHSASSLVAAVAQVVGGLFSTVMVIVISFYLAVREKGIENFLRSVTPLEHETYIVHLWQRSQHKMGRWVQSQLFLGLIVGLTAYVGLTLLHVPFALLLAILAAVLELIPMVGPILAAIPAVIIAFFVNPLTGLLTVVLYSIIQPVENHILVPQIMKRTLGLSPVIIIVAILVGAKLGGIVGMLLALPLAAALNEVFDDLTERRREAMS